MHKVMVYSWPDSHVALYLSAGFLLPTILTKLSAPSTLRSSQYSKPWIFHDAALHPLSVTLSISIQYKVFTQGASFHPRSPEQKQYKPEVQKVRILMLIYLLYHTEERVYICRYGCCLGASFAGAICFFQLIFPSLRWCDPSYVHSPRPWP